MPLLWNSNTDKIVRNVVLKDYTNGKEWWILYIEISKEIKMVLT